MYLIKDLQISFNKNLKFVSFDITNMYAKVPVKNYMKALS
jgi:hypothetical protein